MLKELFSIFTGRSALEALAQDFTQMLELSREMVLEASNVFWGKKQTPEQRTHLYENDVQVNKLERYIRKRIVSHLSIAVSPQRNVPYCLMLMSLVKDVERIGDYAKNLVEASDFWSEPLPDDELVAELREIRRHVETLAKEAADVYSSENRDRAIELTREGRSISKRCDETIRRVAEGEYSTGVAVSLALGARFYKRIGAHILNILSSVIMPLHKLDYFDEDYLGD